MGEKLIFMTPKKSGRKNVQCRVQVVHSNHLRPQVCFSFVPRGYLALFFFIVRSQELSTSTTLSCWRQCWMALVLWLMTIRLTEGKHLQILLAQRKILQKYGFPCTLRPVEGLHDIYVICRLRGPYGEKLWPRSWKCCPRPQAEGSIFKPEVTVFHYTDRP